MDDFVFLLPRPEWQADEQANICNRCHARFSLFIRKHHCRHCGLVHCHHCCSRKTPLRQLGYLEQVRVCESCFEIAYLISYVLHYESKSTQLHGARGLYELLSKNDDAQLKNFITHGGFEAFIFLSQKSLSPDIHLLSMMALRFLFENDHLQTMLIDSNSSQRHERTFGVLIRTITTILDIYLLVPEVQGDDIGVHSIQRIIFNAVMTGARLVFLLCPYPPLLKQIIQSRWLYLFLDAIEQAFQDCGFHPKIVPKPIKFLPDGNLSKSDCLSLRGVFDDELRSQQGLSSSISRRVKPKATQDDIWIDALELQVVASGTICMLCDLVCKEPSIRFNRHEVKSRIMHLLDLYPDPSDPEVFHFQPGLSAAIKNLNQTIQILDQA